jgi:penicillin-insensitive murein endopeptidase
MALAIRLSVDLIRHYGRIKLSYLIFCIGKCFESCKAKTLEALRQMKNWFLILVILLCNFFSAKDVWADSICFGTTANGRLEKGEAMPRSGPNFKTYSEIGWVAGRTYVHSKVKKAIIKSYQDLEVIEPQKKFVYGETGWKNGGKFKPHKTHQNGLSVDLMVPVVERDSRQSVFLPTSAFNKWGYDIEFDKNGHYQDLAIDFEVLARLIEKIHKASLEEDIGIDRVIIDPLFIAKLHSTSLGDFMGKNIKIPTKKSWVRHDEHIHIDFQIKCQSS